MCWSWWCERVQRKEEYGSVLTKMDSSYPTTWNPSTQVSMPHTPGSATYPASTMPPEPYPKISLSGTPGFTAEPQEMPMQPTSMPSVQLPLVAQDQQQPPIRTQYATYVQGTSAPPHLSLSATTATDNSLAIPRYVDTNPRPSKSPRHASHQSVGSSISNETASGEYRYGPPPPQQTGVYPQPPSATAAGDVLSPQSQHHHLPPPHPHTQGGAPSAPAGYGPPPQDGSTATAASSAGTASAAAGGAPPRDYFPPSQSWTTTAGEGSAGSYTNGGAHAGGGAAGGAGPGPAAAGADRPYAFPASHQVKPESHGGHAHQGGAAAGQAGYGGYAWNAA